MLQTRKLPLSEIAYSFVAKYLQKTQEIKKQIVNCPHNDALGELFKLGAKTMQRWKSNTASGRFGFINYPQYNLVSEPPTDQLRHFSELTTGGNLDQLFPANPFHIGSFI